MALHLSKTCDTMVKLVTGGPTSISNVLTRQKKFNFVKTGDSTSVDSDKLKNDRILSLRITKVNSALELEAGDHIKHPACKPLPSSSYHHNDGG